MRSTQPISRVTFTNPSTTAPLNPGGVNKVPDVAERGSVYFGPGNRPRETFTPPNPHFHHFWAIFRPNRDMFRGVLTVAFCIFGDQLIYQHIPCTHAQIMT